MSGSRLDVFCQVELLQKVLFFACCVCQFLSERIFWQRNVCWELRSDVTPGA